MITVGRGTKQVPRPTCFGVCVELSDYTVSVLRCLLFRLQETVKVRGRGPAIDQEIGPGDKGSAFTK